MSTTSYGYRAVEYRPSEGQPIDFWVTQNPETDAMTDTELIARYKPCIEQFISSRPE